MRWREKAGCILLSAAVSAALAYLFYRSVWGMLLFPAVCWFVSRRRKKNAKERRQKQIRLEFKDAMLSVTTALTAGYSMENAWREAERELGELYHDRGILATEFSKMNAAVQMNQPLEVLMQDLAEETEVEDILLFAEVFSFAKRGGGDFIHIIETTSRHIREKMEVEQEMETVIAGKKMEQKIMNGIPLFILFYLDLASPGFLDLLYGNLLGIAVMSAALAVYAGALFWAEQIMAIEV